MLAGKKVSLRRVEPSDHPDILRWQNDPEVFRMMDYVAPFSLEDIERSEARAMEEGHPFLIELEGAGVGRIGLNNLRPRDGLASMYLFVGERTAWGKGVGLDAVMTLLRFAFEHLGLRAVELWTLADNERAIKLYKMVGFVEDARLPERSFKEGRYIDHLVMRVDRAGFARARDALAY